MKVLKITTAYDIFKDIEETKGAWEKEPQWFILLKKDIEEKTKKEATKERVIMAAYRHCCKEFFKIIQKQKEMLQSEEDCELVWKNPAVKG